VVFRILPHEFGAKASSEGPSGKRALPTEPTYPVVEKKIGPRSPCVPGQTRDYPDLVFDGLDPPHLAVS
jgi:hypothetical protein